MQVGAYDFSGDHALSSVAVTFSDFNRSKSLRAIAGDCPTSVIFESSQWSEVDDPIGGRELRTRCKQFANRPSSVDTDGFAIKKSKSRTTRSIHVRKPMSKDLHPRANGKNDSAVLHCAMKTLALFEFSSGLNLRAILAAADEVQVC